jgi:rhodanese-related sulfurtransferase
VRAIKLGYKNVYTLPPGIMGWEKAGKPVEKGS